MHDESVTLKTQILMCVCVCIWETCTVFGCRWKRRRVWWKRYLGIGTLKASQCGEQHPLISPGTESDRLSRRGRRKLTIVDFKKFYDNLCLEDGRLEEYLKGELLGNDCHSDVRRQKNWFNHQGMQVQQSRTHLMQLLSFAGLSCEHLVNLPLGSGSVWWHCDLFWKEPPAPEKQEARVVSSRTPTKYTLWQMPDEVNSMHLFIDLIWHDLTHFVKTPQPFYFVAHATRLWTWTFDSWKPPRSRHRSRPEKGRLRSLFF